MTHRLVTLLLLALAQAACLLDESAEQALDQRRCASDAECASGLCREGYCALRAPDAGSDAAPDAQDDAASDLAADPDPQDDAPDADADPQDDADAQGDADAPDEGTDQDGDGAQDAQDNCPDEFNPPQGDGDQDGVGDVCDSCPEDANTDQADADGDGVGDVCELPILHSCSVDGSCTDGQADQATPSGFSFIAHGGFTMGSPPGEPGRSGDEGARFVEITRDFIVSQGELTNQEWTQAGLPYPSDPPVQASSYPAHWVNFWEALAYLNARSRADGLDECYLLQGCAGTLGGGRTGGNYTCQGVTFVGLDCEGWRLPTEAEWEYATRAGASTAFPSGEITQSAEQRWCADPTLDPIGWYCGNAPLNANNNNMPIHTRGKQKAPNAWGLYDTQGNLQEWTWDWYAPFAGASQETLLDPLGPANGAERAVRGGSVNADARQCRAASRNPDTNAPAWSGQAAYTPGWRDRFTGLRAARTFR
jgi:formylglycine-generating enzyme required for sulfatase activity